MDYSIYLRQTANFKIFVDRDPDVQEDNICRFHENRIVPVYFYFTNNKDTSNYKTGHLIKTCPGDCTLPCIDQPVHSLLSVSGFRLRHLLEFTNTCRKNKINLDNMPEQFFSDFALALTVRGFNKDKGRRIYRKYKL